MQNDENKMEEKYWKSYDDDDDSDDDNYDNDW